MILNEDGSFQNKDPFVGSALGSSRGLMDSGNSQVRPRMSRWKHHDLYYPHAAVWDFPTFQGPKINASAQDRPNMPPCFSRFAKVQLAEIRKQNNTDRFARSNLSVARLASQSAVYPSRWFPYSLGQYTRVLGEQRCSSDENYEKI